MAKKDICEVIAHAIVYCSGVFECDGSGKSKWGLIEKDSENNLSHKNLIVQNCLDKYCPSIALKKIVEIIRVA